MSDDLRVKLGKSKVESHGQEEVNPKWPHWAEAVAAYKSGWRMPEKRFPIIISPKGPISSPEKLQKLADLPSVPKVSVTKTLPLIGDEFVDGFKSENVQICDVNWDQLEKIRERTEHQRQTHVWFEDSKRVATVVLSVKRK